MCNKGRLLCNKAGLLNNTPRVIFITPRVILVTPKEKFMVRDELKKQRHQKYGREMEEEINTSIFKYVINKAYQMCLWKMVVK